MTSSASVGLRLGGLAAAGLIAAGVAGCASSGSSSTAAGSATTPAATSGTGTGAASGTGSSAPSSPAGGTGSVSPSGGSSGSGGSGTSADACTTGNLKVKTADSEGAAGSTYTTLEFTNAGSTSCTLYGYPGVSLAAGNPAAQVGAAASRSSVDSPSVVKLAPGKTANALLRITQALNYPKTTCSPADTAYLRIYPPGETNSILLSYKSMGCSKTSVVLLTIGVVQAGATSSQ